MTHTCKNQNTIDEGTEIRRDSEGTNPWTMTQIYKAIEIMKCTANDSKPMSSEAIHWPNETLIIDAPPIDG